MTACSGGDSDGGETSADAAVSVIDGAPGQDDAAVELDASTDCPAQERVVIGGCDVTGSDQPCMGYENDMIFVPLESGDTLEPVVGFQGTAMFVFGFHVSNVDPGSGDDPLDLPTVVVRVEDQDGQVVSSADSKPALTEIDTATYEGFGLQLPFPGDYDQYDGVQLSASMRITDRTGHMECGSIDFLGAKAAIPQF
jgi:hypothetical protein